jgi:cysteine desulfurase
LRAATPEALHIVPIDNRGVVDFDAFVDACMKPGVGVAALMLVSNELGIVQPVADIAARLRSRGFEGHFHVDAIQALGKLPLRLAELGADSIALSAHKIHGPKGVGAVAVRKGISLRPLWGGGKHEAGLRPGTENAPGIVGFGAAAALALETLADAPGRMIRLRERLVEATTRAVPSAYESCSGGPRAPHIASLVFRDTLAEPLVHALEARGVFASAGSACHSRERGPSHVAAALGLGPLDGMIRFSLARTTTEEDIDAATAVIPEAAKEARL